MLVVVLATVGALMTVVILAHHEWLLFGLHRTAASSVPPPARWPRVTVFRPIRGLDPGAAENLDALLRQDYPGAIEFIFLIDLETDPSYPIVQAAIARNPGVRARLVLTGEPPPTRTGKIHNMIVGVESSDAEVYAFSDSDTRPPRHLLRELVSTLQTDPSYGIAFAPTVAVAHDALPGDIGYALLVNAWYGAALDRVAEPSGVVPFAMGQYMAMRASALAAIGGMRAAEGELVDDMFLGRRMIEEGYRNVMTTTRVPLIIGRMSMREFLRIFRKWIFFSQSGLPVAFKRAGWMRAVPGLTAWIVLLAGAVLGSGWTMLAGGLALAAFVFSQVRLSHALGGAVVSPLHYWIAAALPFLASGVAASTKVNREVDWRGRHYRLDDAGRLRAVSTVAPRPASMRA